VSKELAVSLNIKMLFGARTLENRELKSKQVIKTCTDCDRISMRFFGEVAWLDFPLDKANEEKT